MIMPLEVTEARTGQGVYTETNACTTTGQECCRTDDRVRVLVLAYR